MKKTFTLSLAFVVILVTGVAAQEQFKHEPKTFTDKTGKFYINKTLPLYLYLDINESGLTKKKLKSESSPKYSSPFFLDKDGYNAIRTPWLVNPKTRKTVYPKRDLIFEIYADSKAPSTKITYPNAAQFHLGDTLYLGKSYLVNLKSYDAVSGVDKAYYSLNGKAYIAYGNNFELPGEQLYNIKFYAADRVGNAASYKMRKVFPDRSTPVTEMKILGDKYKDILSVRSKVELTASDKFAGVKQVYYQLDSGAITPYNREVSLNRLSEGLHAVSYYASDNVLNQEPIQKYEFWLDRTSPIIIDELLGDNTYINGVAYSSGRTKLKLTAVDNKAGLKAVYFSVNGEPYKKYERPFYISSKKGNAVIKYYALDNVNNKSTSTISSTSSTRTIIDLTGPTINRAFIGPQFTMLDTVYISAKTNIKLSGSDTGAGMSYINYSIDKLKQERYADLFNVNEEGFKTVSYFGYDYVNNSSRKVFSFVVDAQGPEITIQQSVSIHMHTEVDSVQVPVFPPHVIIWLSAFDKVTGTKNIAYAINNGAFVPYTGQLRGFKTNKVYYLKVRATDVLGNSEEKEFVFKTTK